jgi:amino acid transporter
MADKFDISGRVAPPAVARATVLGTIATAVVYMLSLTVVFGIVPTSDGGRGRDHAR